VRSKTAVPISTRNTITRTKEGAPALTDATNRGPWLPGDVQTMGVGGWVRLGVGDQESKKKLPCDVTRYFVTSTPGMCASVVHLNQPMIRRGAEHHVMSNASLVGDIYFSSWCLFTVCALTVITKNAVLCYLHSFLKKQTVWHIAMCSNDGAARDENEMV